MTCSAPIKQNVLYSQLEKAKLVKKVEIKPDQVTIYLDKVRNGAKGFSSLFKAHSMDTEVSSDIGHLQRAGWGMLVGRNRAGRNE